MNGDQQTIVKTSLTADDAKRLERYCTIRGIKQRDAIRRAITHMLRDSEVRQAPRFDSDKPL